MKTSRFWLIAMLVVTGWVAQAAPGSLRDIQSIIEMRHVGTQTETCVNGVHPKPCRWFSVLNVVVSLSVRHQTEMDDGGQRVCAFAIVSLSVLGQGKGGGKPLRTPKVR